MSVKFAGYTTAGRPAGVDGQVIYDTDLSQLFVFCVGNAPSGTWELVGGKGPWKYRTIITTG